MGSELAHSPRWKMKMKMKIQLKVAATETATGWVELAAMQ